MDHLRSVGEGIARGDRPGGFAAWIEAGAERVMAAWSRRSPVAISTAALMCILAVEFCLLASNARQLRFWYDELLTLHYASLRPFSATVDALLAGKDMMTLAFMAVMSAAAGLPGDIHINLRLPTIAGYLLTLAGVFYFTRRRIGGAWAVAAVLFIALSPFRSFAIEARPYAMVTGFLAVAAVGWQMLGERRWAAPLMYVFFLMSVATHYFAGMLIACLAGAEAVYALRERRARWSVWGLAAAAALLVSLQAPLILHTRTEYSGSEAYNPPLERILVTYKNYLAVEINHAVLIVALAVTVLLALMAERWRREAARAESGGGFSAPELALALMLTLYPAMVVTMTIIAHTWYLPRYAWPVIVGLAILWGIICSSIKVRLVAAALMASMVLAFSLQTAKDLGRMISGATERMQKGGQSPPGLDGAARAYPGHEVVVADPKAFVEMSYYSGHGLNGRLAQLLMPDGRLGALSESVPDRANRLLSSVIPLRVREADAFVETHREFILYAAGTGRPSWVLGYLEERGYTFRSVKGAPGGGVLLASRGE
ncbi:MAG: hypothetical protein C0504_02635 [Candidatus Solibacter sp.]|nr:hypothetical protein [Candidatus Solibacter sp.]